VFDVGIAEIFVLALVALFIFGPDRLPDVARQAGRFVRQLRGLASQARTQIAEELGPEFADLDLKDLDPKALVKKHLLDDVEDDKPKQRRGHRPLEEGEAAPFDVDAT